MSLVKAPVLSDSTAPALSAPAARARAGGASLDVLRFLAAGFILFFHYGSNAPNDLSTVFPILQQGWLATDFFLMLSGYILSRAYADRLAAGKMRRRSFVLKRFARLWPSHMVVLLAMGAFVLACKAVGFEPHHGYEYTGVAFVAQVFMVHGWGLLHEPGWNVPTWTISALLICYTLFSVYVPWLYRRSVWIMAAIVVAVLVAAQVLALGVVHHPYVDLPFAWGLLRAVPLFMIGNLIERATAGVRVSKAVFWACLMTVFVSIGLLLQWPRNATIDTAILCWLGVVLAVSGTVTFGETKITQRFGRASFALFLTHSLIGAVWFGLSPKLIAHFGLSVPAQWGLWTLGVATAMVTAFAFDAWVDKPLSAWVQKRWFLKSNLQP